MADDQLAIDTSVHALLNNHKRDVPLVLLVDDKYALFPYDLTASDVTYAVLGFYRITHVWSKTFSFAVTFKSLLCIVAECQPAQNNRGAVLRYKFCFQWCESQGNPWWWPPNGEIESIISSISYSSTFRWN
jgi:hypothetical protein